ncbi:MAG: hypothetical protein HKN87_08765 [Saprospiraceae bacterium]|nr:hypothetical protein [Saprospiraceae bacterium]
MSRQVSENESSEIISRIYDAALSGTKDPDLTKLLIAYLSHHQIEIPDKDFDTLLWKSLTTASLLERSATSLQKGSGQGSAFHGKIENHCSVEVATLIVEIIRGRQWLFVEEVLRLLKAHKLTLHPISLPTALHGLAKKHQLWHLLCETTDEIASWLAKQDSNWSWFVEITDAPDPEKSTGNEVTWILWRRAIHKFIILPEVFLKLPASQQKKLWSSISSKPKSTDEPWLRWALKHRPAKEKNQALQALARLNTPERQSLRDLARETICTNIFSSQGDLHWQRHEVNLPKPFKILSRGNHAKTDVFLLSTLSPAEMFAHLKLDADEICRQIMTDASLKELGEAIIISAQYTPDSAWIELLILFWLKHYPRFNTQHLDLLNLLPLLDLDQFSKMLTNLLSLKDEYFIEKLSLYFKHSIPYVSQQLSTLLINEILFISQNNLSRTDTKWLKELLQVLVWRVDPRSHRQLAKLWPEANLHYSPLHKSFEVFRNLLEKRFDLFAYISGLK